MKRLLFLCLLFTTLWTSVLAQTDSLRVEKDGDKVLVVHKVISKQTLFALARRYGTTVAAITKQNPSVANGLQVGQVLKIPYGKALIGGAGNITHTVASGETLFAIASKYGIKIDEIKNLNELTSNSLSLGQVLLIEKGNNSDDATPAAEIADADIIPIEKPETEIPVMADSTTSANVETPEVAPVLEVPDPSDELSSTPFREVKEEGTAELIEEGEETTKFLALHRTAPTGTVIKIRNRMNDLTVYVRVIGKLPDTGENTDVMIKINKRTYDQLKALDKRFLVELSYFL